LQDRLVKILEPYRGQRGAAIPVLQKVQEELGYLDEESISEVANFLGQTKNEIYGVASFYAQFRFERQGEHVVRVCQGTACHVRGSHRILEAVQLELKIPEGKNITDDGKFSIERVACFGSCALAPVMVLDKTVYGRMTTSRVRQILAEAQGDKP